MPRWKQRLAGMLMALLGAAGTWWVWRTAFSEGYYSEKAAMIFPAIAVVGLGLILLPGYREERLARGEDISRIQGRRLITARWWAILVMAVCAGVANYLLLLSQVGLR